MARSTQKRIYNYCLWGKFSTTRTAVMLLQYPIGAPASCTHLIRNGGSNWLSVTPTLLKAQHHSNASCAVQVQLYKWKCSVRETNPVPSEHMSIALPAQPLWVCVLIKKRFWGICDSTKNIHIQLYLQSKNEFRSHLDGIITQGKYTIKIPP